MLMLSKPVSPATQKVDLFHPAPKMLVAAKPARVPTEVHTVGGLSDALLSCEHNNWAARAVLRPFVCLCGTVRREGLDLVTSDIARVDYTRTGKNRREVEVRGRISFLNLARMMVISGVADHQGFTHPMVTEVAIMDTEAASAAVAAISYNILIDKIRFKYTTIGVQLATALGMLVQHFSHVRQICFEEAVFEESALEAFCGRMRKSKSLLKLTFERCVLTAEQKACVEKAARKQGVVSLMLML